MKILFNLAVLAGLLVGCGPAVEEFDDPYFLLSTDGEKAKWTYYFVATESEVRSKANQWATRMCGPNNWKIISTVKRPTAVNDEVFHTYVIAECQRSHTIQRQ